MFVFLIKMYSASTHPAGKKLWENVLQRCAKRVHENTEKLNYYKTAFIRKPQINMVLSKTYCKKVINGIFK